jgi:3-oxoacyl-[acyl-carrier protein] reductase
MTHSRVAIVTGASQGIGAATARALAADGFAVVLAARSSERIDMLAAEIGDQGGRTAAITTDVSDTDAVEHLVDETVRRFERLDVLVNNAAQMPTATRSEKMSLDAWSNALAVNLTGPWWLANRAHDAMVASGEGGVVVNVTSTAATYPSVGFAAYNASKAALSMLTRTLALEWARDGIRVIGVAPGKIDTPMVEPILAWTERQGIPVNPLGRVGRPDEVASLISFLVSERASYMTGNIVTLDGGELLQH